ncbi:hypothetical protein BGX38DRAFT_1334174 [Terfezia claveryi]|nr:hypothetical protein BGX38DRAFT_1334174 [Terfezia claveryi]
MVVAHGMTVTKSLVWLAPKSWFMLFTMGLAGWHNKTLKKKRACRAATYASQLAHRHRTEVLELPVENLDIEEELEDSGIEETWEILDQELIMEEDAFGKLEASIMEDSESVSTIGEVNSQGKQSGGSWSTAPAAESDSRGLAARHGSPFFQGVAAWDLEIFPCSLHPRLPTVCGLISMLLDTMIQRLFAP